MSYKKSSVSYGIWALYLMSIGIVLSFMGMVVGNQDAGAPYMALILLALAFGALFLVYFLAKKLVDSVQVKKMTSGRTALMEAILVAVFLVAGILLRLMGMEDAGEEAAYYEVAKVTEGGMRVQLVQGSVYYYLCLLNLLFRLVGNKWMAGIVLQIMLQMLGILVAYFAVKRLSGKGPALVSLPFLTVAPGAVRDGITYSPKMLYFCIYALILLIIAQYLWRSTRPGGKVITWGLAVVCGALVAFAGYMDIVGFTLAIPLCGLPVLKREQRGMLQWVIQFMLSMLAMAGTFCLLVQLDSAMSNSTFERVLGAWSITYGLKGADYSFFFQEGGYETILLLVLMALGIFTFMRRKNEEIFSPWVMMVLSVTLMRVLGVMTPNMNGSFQMYFAMTGLAGVAFCELFVREGGRVEEMSDAPEELSQESVSEQTETLPLVSGWSSEQPLGGKTTEAVSKAEPARSGISEEITEAVGEAEPPKSSKEGREMKPVRRSRKKQRQQEQGDAQAWEPLPQEPGTRQDTPASAVPTAEEKKDMTEKKQDKPKQVQLIENPLPLPKKHVKKVMDYPIQPDASQMHYDIEVDPKDNFDF